MGGGGGSKDIWEMPKYKDHFSKKGLPLSECCISISKFEDEWRKPLIRADNQDRPNDPSSGVHSRSADHSHVSWGGFSLHREYCPGARTFPFFLFYVQSHLPNTRNWNSVVISHLIFGLDEWLDVCFGKCFESRQWPSEKKILATTKDVFGKSVFFARSFSQGSVCLKKIPLSLRTLFRKTSVQLPDMETLLCGILR